MSHSKKYRDRKKLTLAAATKTRPDESPGGGGRERSVGSNERERRNSDIITPRHPHRTTTTTTTTWRRGGVRRRDFRSSQVRSGAELSLVRMRTTVTEFSLGGCGLLGLSEGESDGQWRNRNDGGEGDCGGPVKYPSQISGADPGGRTQAEPSYQLLESQGTPRPELPPTHSRAAGRKIFCKNISWILPASQAGQPFMWLTIKLIFTNCLGDL